MKVEVHSSSSGAGSDENLSSSDLSERSGDHDHDYEDIYLVREDNKAGKTDKNNNSGGAGRSRSRDSGSHSRSGSASSSNSGCNVVVKVTPQKLAEQKEVKKANEFLPKPQKYEKVRNRFFLFAERIRSTQGKTVYLLNPEVLLAKNKCNITIITTMGNDNDIRYKLYMVDNKIKCMQQHNQIQTKIYTIAQKLYLYFNFIFAIDPIFVNFAATCNLSAPFFIKIGSP